MKTAPLSAVAFVAFCAIAGSLSAQPSLTIYNQDFAVVRDEVPLDLKAGIQTAIYSGATSTMEPDSVILRDPKGKVELQILEQSYRNDAVTQEYLLSLFEGQEIDFQTYNDNRITVVKGKVIRSGFVRAGRTPGAQADTYIAPIVEVDGKLQFSLPGLPLFPTLGDDTILEPQLEWKLRASAEAKLNAEVAYLTSGLRWEADYNLVAPEKGGKVDIIGWITMENNSGKTFTDADVKLLAGEVSKIEDNVRAMRRDAVAFAPQMAMEATVTEKAFDDFHLYTLQNRVTLRSAETKQVEFVRASGVTAKRLYVIDAVRGPVYGEGYGGDLANVRADVIREFENTKENGLGIPLPKGKLRFYLQDDDRRLEFTGENLIDHTPRNETISVTTGKAFDIVGERIRTDWKIDTGRKTAEETVKIKVRNRKDEPVEVIVREHLARWPNWEITAKSIGFEKKTARQIDFKLPLKPDEEGEVTYTVRYTW